VAVPNFKPAPFQFSVDDTNYTFDVDDLTLDEAEQVKARTGLSLWDFGAGIVQGDPSAIKALIVLAKKRAGERVDWTSPEIGNLRVAPVAKSIAEIFIRDTQKFVEQVQAQSTDGNTQVLLDQVERDLDSAAKMVEVPKKPVRRKRAS